MSDDADEGGLGWRRCGAATRIVRVLDEEGLTVRRAQELTGFAAANFSRLRRAKLGRFTVDRLMAMLDRLGQEVELSVTPSTPGSLRRGGGLESSVAIGPEVRFSKVLRANLCWGKVNAEDLRVMQLPKAWVPWGFNVHKPLRLSLASKPWHFRC